VIGGGNVAIDTARSARRLGAAAVHLVCLEHRTEMPAFGWEVDEALSEGVLLHDGWGIARFRGAGSVEVVELKRCISVVDDTGRFRPSYDEARRDGLNCDVAIVAVGMGADTAAFPLLAPAGTRVLQADPTTLQTAIPWVFAAGGRGDRPYHDRPGRGPRPPGRPHGGSMAARPSARRIR